MTTSLSRTAAWLPACLLAVGCAGAATPARGPAPRSQSELSPAAQVRADRGKQPFTPADLEFVSGMISHHAQAVLMATWAPSHGAGSSVAALCERIVVAQRDEIAFMQRWLKDRGQPVPQADPTGYEMPGMNHKMLMPGMLTPEQMAELDRARGADFDRLFLTYMIQHHRGAIAMVDQLFAARGAGQDEYVFKFAADVNADQTTEIDRMTLMLNALKSK